MRTLGIDTSSRRGSVALVENGAVVVALDHEAPQAHAERMLPLVEEALAAAGWPRHTLERIGVGVGPGAFTGLRIGIALAQGLALGLGIPLVGIGSLAAMAAAVPLGVPGLRQALLDARRDELFVARYAADGTELLAARAVPRAGFVLEADVVHVGEVTGELDGEAVALARPFRSLQSDLPHASWVAVLAGRATPDGLPVEPLYVREADAVKPSHPPDALVRELATPSRPPA